MLGKVPLSFCRHASAVILLIILTSCTGVDTISSVPVRCDIWPPKAMQESTGMYGPEDIVLDTNHTYPRLIISSLERRSPLLFWLKPTGDLFEMNLHTHAITKLPRTDEPQGFELRPHGIDLRRIEDITYLYVVAHGARRGQPESVVRYKVLGTTLQFDQTFSQPHHPLLTRPNDVQAEANGGFYVTNLESDDWWPVYPPAPVLHYAGQQWHVVGQFKANGNGVFLHENQLLVADDRTDQIVSIPLDNPEKQRTFLSLKNPDNINQGPGSDLLIASHTSTMKFFLHSYGLASPSPGSIEHVKLEGSPPLKTHSVFVSDGTPLSAPSSAIWFENRLYIGQVYKPFIVDVPVSDFTQTVSCGTSG